jgi:hypothetical protein
MMYLSEIMELDKFERCQLVQLCEALYQALVKRDTVTQIPVTTTGSPAQPFYFPNYLNTTQDLLPQPAKVWCTNSDEGNVVIDNTVKI